jgi:hypothetical protein
MGLNQFDVTGIGAIFDFGSKLVDRLFPDKIAQEKERNAAQIALAQMTQSGEIEQLKVTLSAILAEAQSPDPWTSRARPSFMYVMYLMILAAIPMGILSAFRPDMAVAIATGMKSWLVAIPDSLYALFGVGFTGYSLSRSIEKRLGLAK